MLRSMGRCMAFSRIHAAGSLGCQWTMGRRTVSSGLRAAAARFDMKGTEELHRKMLDHIARSLTKDQVISVLDALQQGKLQLSDAELQKLVRTLPSLLGLSYEDTIVPKLDALQQGKLQLSDAELQKLVLRTPKVLSLSYEGNIAPTLDALQQGKLQLSDAELQKLVRSLPPVLGLSYEGSIAPKLEYLATALQLQPAALTAIVIGQPSLLSTAQSTLKSNIETYKTLFAELSDEEFCTKLAQSPRELGIGSARLQARVQACHEADIPTHIAFGKARYTNESFAEYVLKHKSKPAYTS